MSDELRSDVRAMFWNARNSSADLDALTDAAISLIRAEVLEEAAKVAETCEWWKVPLKDDDERTPIAAAIRAMKKERT